MLDVLTQLRKKVVIGFVGGSDLAKISEQLAVDGGRGGARASSSFTLILFVH